jgi:2,3-dihydroxybenzoate decarboxylase
MLHGIAHGKFLDDRRFWLIYARRTLDVPIYLHPSPPHAAVTHYATTSSIPHWCGGLGYTVETATTAIRGGRVRRPSAPEGHFGHLGETLPFLVWRIDRPARPGQKPLSFRDVLWQFHITTSGNFSNPALLCSAMEMGIDRCCPRSTGRSWKTAGDPWMDTVPLCDEDKVKIQHQQRVLHLDGTVMLPKGN